MYDVGVEVERRFYQIEAKIVVQAHEYAEHERAAQVEWHEGA